ncbi:MAG TPA: tetratricopeptide repeat protein [Candidatus Sulfotelmatobacter sp.]|nr:tetratricopeptide repeat protein [Candidatus Sulfotelmatobacter sp.]
MRRTIVAILLAALTLPLNAQSLEGGRLEPAQLFQAAFTARQNNKLNEALSLFRQAASTQRFVLADYAEFEIGETFFATREYGQAIPEYSRLAADHPDSLLLPRAALMLGKSYFNSRDYPRAIKALADLTAKYPTGGEAAEAQFLIAKAREKQNKWQEAYLAYEETDLLYPLTDFSKQARLAIKALKAKHKRKLPVFKASAAALFKKGMAYFDGADYEMAVNIFSRLAREYPGSKKYIGEAWLMLGRAEMQTNRSSAISDLERATEGPPNLAGRAYYYLGLAYGRRGKADRAITYLKKVTANYPDSAFADEAAYWAAYYRESAGDLNGALTEYYEMINKYPYSKSVPAAIWRIGHAYYWNGNFQNAATYFHMAQLYPATEDTPRCLFFEGKALERLGNRAQSLAVYEQLVKRFDHTYYAYRAKERAAGCGLALAEQSSFNGADFSQALSEIDDKDQDELSAIMEIWENTKAGELTGENSAEAQVHLAKYKELMELGLAGYAADEARYLVDITSDSEKEPVQTKLGEMLAASGNYRTPIRFADRKISAAVLAGKPQSISKKVWQLSYPRGYWQSVVSQANSYGVDPYLVLAVIREESRFNPRATSRSGARGLMQIMPRTGRSIAKQLELPRYRTSKLFKPDVNVNMGVYYLADLVKRFSNNAYLALAGYNGGPNRVNNYVKTWYNGNYQAVDIDEFVESIPVREMRLYVQKVMGSYFEYKRLYDRKRG